MKTKGITIWEKHAEKIIVAIAVVAAVGFTAMQFIGQPNAVQKAGRTIAPGEIDDVLREQARTLLVKFDDKAAMPPEAQIPDPVGALDALMTALNGSVNPQLTLPATQMALAPRVAGLKSWGTNAEFPVPQIKAPDRILIAQTADTLEEGVVDQFPELKELFDDSAGPKDVLYATAFALFDLADLRYQFVGDDTDDPDRVIIPPNWYNDRPENLVDVVIERQVLAAGEWSDPKTLDPIPGQYSFRKQIEGELDVALRDEVLDQLGEPLRQVAVVRPAFYRTRNNDFEIPDLADKAEKVDDDIARHRESLRQANHQLETRLEELESLGGTRKRREDRGSAGGRRGGDDKGGGGGGNPSGRRRKGGKRDAPGQGGGTGMGVGGAPGAEGGGDEPTGGRINPRVELRMNRKLDQLEQRIDDLVAKLEALGVDPFDDGDGATDAFALLEDDTLVIWGHDLYVEPGRTYRYRLTVKVYNPFFGKKRTLVEAQQHLAESLTLSSATSQWSDPVRISPAIRVFITRAAPPNGRGGMGALGSATAEIYRYYDGHHWVESFTVTPGEYIGGVRTMKLPNGGSVDIDFSTNLFVLDIVEDIDSSNDSPGRLLNRPDAKVLLQDYKTGEIFPLRDPVADSRHPERSRLRAKHRAYSGA